MKRALRDSGVPIQRQIDRWENTPWTQRIEPCESGLTMPRPLSDEMPVRAGPGVLLGVDIDFNDDR